MSVTLNNKILQTSVAYDLQDTVGAIAQNKQTRTYDIDLSYGSTGTFAYGQWVEVSLAKQAAKVAATTPVSSVAGCIGFENAGVIDDAGYSSRIYSTVPVLRQGIIYVASTGTITLGSKLGLMTDPSKTGYNCVVDITASTPSGAIDISTIAKPYAANVIGASGYVAVNIIIL